jgi:cytoskeletal protein RodZ
MHDDQSILGLQTIRRNRGISLEQIAAATKISVRSLEAIERGDFRKLPGGIYNTNYIRQYARAIDYDEQAILAVYHQATSEAGTGPRLGRNVRGIFGTYLPVSTTGS